MKIKKIFFYVIIIINCNFGFSENNQYIPNIHNSYIPSYNNFKNDFKISNINYITTDKIPILNNYGIFTNNFINTNTILKNQDIVCVDNFFYLGNNDSWISLDGVKINKSDVFPEYLLYKNNQENHYWIPTWYLNIIDNPNYISLINQNIPKTKNFITIFDENWINDIDCTAPCYITFTNIYINISLLGNIYKTSLLIKNIKKKGNVYIVKCIPDNLFSLNEFKSINSMMENFPDKDKNGDITLKIDCSNPNIKIINPKTNNIIIELANVNKDYYNSIHYYIFQEN